MKRDALVNNIWESKQAEDTLIHIAGHGRCGDCQAHDKLALNAPAIYGAHRARRDVSAQVSTASAKLVLVAEQDLEDEGAHPKSGAQTRVIETSMQSSVAEAAASAAEAAAEDEDEAD